MRSFPTTIGTVHGTTLVAAVALCLVTRSAGAMEAQYDTIQLNHTEMGSTNFTINGTLTPIPSFGLSNTYRVEPVVYSSNCGNGVREGSEHCDGTAMGTGTCASLGFAGGSLSCSVRCTYITTACTNVGSSASSASSGSAQSQGDVVSGHGRRSSSSSQATQSSAGATGSAPTSSSVGSSSAPASGGSASSTGTQQSAGASASASATGAQESSRRQAEQTTSIGASSSTVQSSSQTVQEPGAVRDDDAPATTTSSTAGSGLDGTTSVIRPGMAPAGDLQGTACIERDGALHGAAPTPLTDPLRPTFFLLFLSLLELALLVALTRMRSFMHLYEAIRAYRQ